MFHKREAAIIGLQAEIDLIWKLIHTRFAQMLLEGALKVTLATPNTQVFVAGVRLAWWRLPLSWSFIETATQRNLVLVSHVFDRVLGHCAWATWASDLGSSLLLWSHHSPTRPVLHRVFESRQPVQLTSWLGHVVAESPRIKAPVTWEGSHNPMVNRADLRGVVQRKGAMGSNHRDPVFVVAPHERKAKLRLQQPTAL